MGTKATEIQDIAYHQGISDFMRYKNRMPIYWKNTAEGEYWQTGHNYAAAWNKS